MGFSKRYISKEGIAIKYREGFNSLARYISSPDCLIIEDDFSEKVVDIVMNDDAEQAAEKIERMMTS